MPQVLRKLRKLPWTETEPYLVRKLLHAARARFGAAPLVASLTAGLARCAPPPSGARTGPVACHFAPADTDCCT